MHTPRFDTSKKKFDGAKDFNKNDYQKYLKTPHSKSLNKRIKSIVWMNSYKIAQKYNNQGKLNCETPKI